MKNHLVLFTFLFIIASCSEHKQTAAYKPGLGEFMSSIQMNHAKLWFAGVNDNWDLANFELGEIKETVEDAQHFCSDRPGIKNLPMLLPMLDSLNYSIQNKNAKSFKSSFTNLTTTCNNCHAATNHKFIVIKTPDSEPVSNQVFEIERKTQH